jgi:general secretion pathway protein G
MQKAFTMIELIFVIVILGILAAVAIPRLSATRDDARVSKTAHLIMTGAAEISTYAVSKGNTDANFSAMSNNLDLLLKNQEAEAVTDNNMIIHFGGVNDCIEIDINESNGTETLSLYKNGSGTNRLCDALHSAVHAEAYPMLLKGASIER